MPNPTPRTIEELRAWYIAHNLPPEDVTRFFIGKDIREPRAFGIYRDGGRWIVYKNKEDGSRAVRYCGPDEGYAVNELYQRLKQEIEHQKAGSAFRKEETRKSSRTSSIITVIIIIAVIALIVWFVIHSVLVTPGTGYYRYHDDWYYYYDGWYEYGDDGWYPSSAEQELEDNYNSYYEGYTLDDQSALPAFELTEYYSDKDSESHWDNNDTWDTGTTDWNSDW